jgi:hypothetical protein
MNVQNASSFLTHSVFPTSLFSCYIFFVITTLTSAYAFHVYSWTNALDTDLGVGGFVFMPLSCLESLIERETL